MTHIDRRSFAGGLAAAGASLVIPGVANAQSWANVVAAAEKEGKVSLLGPTIEAYRRTLMEFRSAYPRIRLEYTSASSTDWQKRLLTERRANLFLWDLVISGASGAVFTQQLRQWRWYDPVRPLMTAPDILDDRKWLGGFEAGFVDNDKKYFYAFQAGLQRNTYIDRSKIPVSELNKLSDLLHPKWKGKIALFDPRVRGGGHIVTLILAVLGEDAARRFLAQQKPALTSSLRQIDEWAVRGVYPITSGMSPSEHAMFQKRGLGLNIKPLEFPPEHSAWTPGQAILMYVNRAPHPNAAKVFVNWLLSRDTQEKWATRGLVNSRRLDVPVGLAASKIDLNTFTKGISFNLEKTAGLALKAEAIARSVLG